MKECKHEWKEDEDFRDEAITLFFGNIGEVTEEIRLFCKKCGEVMFVPKGSIFIKDGM